MESPIRVVNDIRTRVSQNFRNFLLPSVARPRTIPHSGAKPKAPLLNWLTTNHSKGSPRAATAQRHSHVGFSPFDKKRSHDIHEEERRARGIARAHSKIWSPLHGRAPRGPGRTDAFCKPTEPRRNCAGPSAFGPRSRHSLSQPDGTERIRPRLAARPGRPRLALRTPRERPRRDGRTSPLPVHRMWRGFMP